MDRLSALLLALVVALVAACTPAGSEPEPGDEPTVAAQPSPGPATPVGDPSDPGAPLALPVGAALADFDSCDGLLDYYVGGASDLVGPWGLGSGPMVALDDGFEVAADTAGGMAEAAARAAGATSHDVSFSTTNVQEQGVDEPDLVKTDGEVIVTVSQGDLRVVDVASAEVVGRLDLPDETWGTELLLAGDDLLVVSTGGESWGGPTEDAAQFPAFAPTRTTLTRVDLADPTSPTITGAVRMEGAVRTARMVDGTVRLVLVSEPTGLAFVQPRDSGLSAEQDALARNRRILAASDLDDWIPHLQVLDADGRPVGAVEPILECGDIAHPAGFSGLATLSVLTMAIDGDGLVPTSGAGLVAAGDTVYASTDRLVVATSPWGRWIEPFVDRIGRPRDSELRTDLHTFDIADPASTTYLASGSVDGTLIGQFALSEDHGVLRVATTMQPSWWAGPDLEASESALVVLAERDGHLVETGRVDGLGVNERIYAVRYLGPDLAAIVTFRETDPLYLVDTSDPTAPVVTGQLKIPGFSSYLHPIGGDRLLGVGQDADEDGRTRGLQVSLFDIAAPAAPERLDQVTLGEGFSPAEHDHRAFLHWAPTGQVVVPAELWGDHAWEDMERACADGGGCIEPTPFLGAVVLREDGDTLVEQGRVTARPDDVVEWWGDVSRSLVIGDHLWTVSEDRLARYTLDGLDDRLVIPLR